ncbi:TIGR03086 family metal-binding protein [Nocardia sp. NPDC050406]|uniref:TIGR03086 family metal-binding protein n=1 Tax=Nocardia sp. NPDC050406 TaxID=3364318 RepID=UPI0037B3AE6A
MDTADNTVALVERALAQMESVIAGVRPDQAELPTPCPGWNVRRLVAHVIGQGLRNFSAAAQGASTDWQAEPDPLSDDWVGEFRARAKPLLDIWHSADLDRLVPVPTTNTEAPLRACADQQIAELAMHTWDLARATGQSPAWDPAVAEHALTWSKAVLRPEFRGPGKAFAPEVPVPDDAPIYDRLAGWFGRDPAFTN